MKTEKRLGTATLILLNILILIIMTLNTDSASLFIINSCYIVFYFILAFSYIQTIFQGRHSTSLPVIVFFSMLLMIVTFHLDMKSNMFEKIIISIVSFFGLSISLNRFYNKRIKKKVKTYKRNNLIEKELKGIL